MYVYKRKVWNAHHHIQLDIRNFLLTSILLSSDPALLRRPRLPAQDMQQQRLETATRPALATQPHSSRASRDSNSLHLPAFLGGWVGIWRVVVVVVVGDRFARAGCGLFFFGGFARFLRLVCFEQLGLVLWLWCWAAARILNGLVSWNLIGHEGFFFFFKHWDILVGWC